MPQPRATDTEPRASASPPLPRWLALGLAALTVVAVAALSLALFRDDFEPVADDPVAADDDGVVVADDFDRPDQDGLADAGHPWSEPRGRWAVQDRHAALVEPVADGSRNLAVLAAGVSDGVARVTATAVEPGWGFAFRVQDADSYWALVAHPESGSWSLDVVVDGVGSTIPAFIDAAPADGDRVEVGLLGDRIAVRINATVANEVTDDTLAGATGLGLVSLSDVNVASMAWDDVEATRR